MNVEDLRADEQAPVTHDERQALTEQVKLLVRPSKRLHRSQNALDRQLVRVELLSQFALRWTAVRRRHRSCRIPFVCSNASSALSARSPCRLSVRLREVDLSAPAGKRPPSGVVSVPADAIAEALGGVSTPIVCPPPSLEARLRELLEQAKVVEATDSAKAMVVVMPLCAGTDAPSG